MSELVEYLRFQEEFLRERTISEKEVGTDTTQISVMYGKAADRIEELEARVRELEREIHDKDRYLLSASQILRDNGLIEPF